jgi:hypothetical protein
MRWRREYFLCGISKPRPRLGNKSVICMNAMLFYNNGQTEVELRLFWEKAKMKSGGGCLIKFLTLSAFSYRSRVVNFVLTPRNLN